MAKRLSMDERLEQNERKRFEFYKFLQLFYAAKEARKEWDSRYEIGKLILQNKYLTDSKLQGDTSNSQFYATDFVRKNIKLAIAESLLPDIDIRLINRRNDINPVQDVLELETNYRIDADRVVRDMEEVLIANKFFGFGAGKTYWDNDSLDADWWTGEPKHKPISANKIFYVSKDNLATKKDLIAIFHREQYTLNQFEIEYPEYYERYKDAVASCSEGDLEANYYYNMKIVNVIIGQYERKEVVKERIVINEEKSSGEMRYFSEEEYEEYLIEKGATPITMDQYKKVGQENAENLVFDEAFNATDAIDRTETRWYQVVFIPEFNIMISEPEIVTTKTRSEYIILPGDWNPDDIYSSSVAFDNKDYLKISGILLSSLVLSTTKLMKPIPIIQEGALKNEATFLQNFYKLGVKAVVDPAWQEKNKGVKAVEWLNPPQAGQMQAMLFQMVEGMLDKSMSTPNSSRGIPDYAGQSGKATELLQMQSKVGAKPDYYSVEEYLRQVADNFKDMIAYKRTYEHKIYLKMQQHIEGFSEIDGMKASIKVNGKDKTQLSEIASQCYSRVSIESNVDQKNMIKDREYKELFASGNIPFDEFIVNQSWAQSPEKLIEANGRIQNDLAVASFINGNPQLKEQVMALMQQNPEMDARDQDG